MTNHTPPPNESDEQRLLDFGDRVANGTPQSPTNDLEATVTRVHHALRTDNADTSDMPTDLKTQIWENVMTTIPIPEAAPSANPWTQTDAPSPTNRRRVHRHSTGPAPYQRMAWSGAANIALTLVLILAAFGAFRAFDGDLPFGGNGSDTPPTMLPGLAMQPSTPKQQVLTAVAATPQATTQTAFACDFSADIPVIPDAMQAPADATSLYVTPLYSSASDPSGTLMLHCPEEPEDIELVKRVLSIYPGPIPGVMSLSLLPEGSTDLSDQYPAYYNLQANKIIELGVPNAMTLGISLAPGSPWLVGPNADAPATLRITDLRTMESTSVPDLPTDGSLSLERTIVSGASERGTLAVNYRGSDNVEIDQATGGGLVTPGATARELGLPGDILILDDSPESPRWLTLPDDLTNVHGMWLSPDGSSLAIATYEPGSQKFDSPLTYAIIDVADGSELARSLPIELIDNPNALWIGDGSSIAFAAGTTVQTLAAEANAQPETVLEGDQQFYDVRTTGDPDVVVATIREDHGSDADPNSTDVDMVYAVNVTTGETHDFAGMEVGNMFSQMITSTNALFMYDFAGMGPDPVTIKVYDPVTGDLVQEIADAPNPNDTGPNRIGKDSFTTTPSGATTVYTTGWHAIYVIQEQDGALTIRMIDPPTEMPGSADVAISSDGATLSMANENDEGRYRWLLDLTNPAAEWLQVPSDGVGSGPGTIRFLEGVD